MRPGGWSNPPHLLIKRVPCDDAVTGQGDQIGDGQALLVIRDDSHDRRQIAPPMMAMTMNDPPTLLSAPSPCKPSAKMVGYIRDMKKLVEDSPQADPAGMHDAARTGAR